MERYTQIPVLIPAYNPNELLLPVVDDLIKYGFENIIIINDGSKSQCQPIFKKLENVEGCHVIHHAVNLGKGRALKTGLNYFSLNFKDSAGVVTADADGQHLPGDIVRVADTLAKNPSRLILGVRKFRGSIPFRSRIGNFLTRYVFFFLLGKKISDTQTGLRGIPRSAVPSFIKLEGEGYEYEMNMLITTKTEAINIIEKVISTVYINNNRSSHFNPLIDSMKIYFLFLRFGFSSIIASLIDFVFFMISYNITSSVYASIFIGRFTIGPVVNYTINKSFVFHSKDRVLISLMKYYAFASIMAIIASGLINTVRNKFMISIMLSKILVETFLFLVSFTIQRDYIFDSKP